MRSPAIDRFDEVTLERTACFGICPTYKVVIHADGAVNYEGEQSVKVTGDAAGWLTAQQVKELVDAINEADYFSLRDTYESSEDGCPTSWTDNPSAITSVSVGGRVKSIRHDYGCRERDTEQSLGDVYPKSLTKLERRIDEIADTARWVGAREHGRPTRK
jgi:hypothetical protein